MPPVLCVLRPHRSSVRLHRVGLPVLYLYDDEATGRRYMGCMNKVFRAEIDLGSSRRPSARGMASAA